MTEAQQLRELLERKIDEVLRAAEAKETSAGDGLDGEQFCDNLKRLKTRAIAREIEKGLGKWIVRAGMSTMYGSVLWFLWSEEGVLGPFSGSIEFWKFCCQLLSSCLIC